MTTEFTFDEARDELIRRCPNRDLHYPWNDEVSAGDRYRLVHEGVTGTIVECPSCRFGFCHEPDEEQPGDPDPAERGGAVGT